MKRNKSFRYYIILLIITLTSFSNSFARELSDQSEVSLLTCSPGEELYSLFGHSGLRFKDPKNNMDIVFNYGTFDFNTPNFYVKFARGKLKYKLAAADFERYKKAYIYEKRGIIEQKLNLDLASKRKLFAAILENYKPENRFYHYDFLFDNCSTRIRDIIEKNTSGKITYPANKNTPKTFWNLLDHFMQKSRWIYLGIHLILGTPCDVEATPYEYMFLPDNMMYAFAEAQIINKDSAVPLVSSTNTILKETLILETTVWYQRPIFIFGVIAILGLIASLFYYRKKKNLFVIDYLLYGASGLLGWIIIFLWFFTDHQATGPNLNILWAIPIHFPLTLIFLARKSIYSYYYFLIMSILLLIVIGCWYFIPQSLPNAILPFVVLLLIRSLYISKKLKIKLAK
nr:DUF4105 domain-containing protein [uncultured Marinifilum sp.]